MMQAATEAVAEGESRMLLVLMAAGKQRHYISYLLSQRERFRYGNNEQALFCLSHQSSL